MDHINKIIKNTNLSLVVFECRYGSTVYSIIANTHITSWVESQLNSSDNDWMLMTDFLDKYKSKLFYSTGSNVLDALTNLNKKLELCDDNESIALNDKIFYYGYGLYKNETNWFDEDKALDF